MNRDGREVVPCVRVLMDKYGFDALSSEAL